MVPEPADAAGGWTFTGAATGNLADHVGDRPADVAARRAAVLTGLPPGVGRVCFAHQVHGAGVHEVTADDVAPAHASGAARSVITLDHQVDALVTRLPGTALAVVVADCVPVLLHDDGAGVVAAVHAGRRGAQQGVVRAAVATARDLGAEDLRAELGPSVCGSCYEVPEDLQHEVGAAHPSMFATTSWGTASLDVAAGVLAQLDELGVPARAQAACTREDPSWFSVRRDGSRTGRGAGVVWTGPAGRP